MSKEVAYKCDYAHLATNASHMKRGLSTCLVADSSTGPSTVNSFLVLII